MTEIDQTKILEFAGTSPIPLSRYLKGLGLLRLVSEQRDKGALGWWRNERFHLATILNREEIESFFLEQYHPSPLIAPWNGGGGFYGRDEALKAIVNSNAERLHIYRQTIEEAQTILLELGLQEKPEKADKLGLVQTCRNRLPDEAVAWIDATIVLTSSDVAFPPLVGTGGNDGNLEFTNNFMQRLVDLISPIDGTPTQGSRNWLRASLWGDSVAGLVKGAIGQFSPGEAGGPNASSGFSGASLVNPWDFVLMLEGVLLFAAAAAKRLESSNSAVLSAPFTVYAAGIGNGSIAETDEGTSAARGETWLPMWNRPASLAEIEYLFREGRAQVSDNRSRRNAHNGVDFARACATLAVDRGIDSFQRYSFLMRSGKAFLAVPLTRFPVRRQAYAELLTELDLWLNKFSRVANSKNAPHTYQSTLRNIRQCIFDYCQYGGKRRMQSLLIALGKAEELLARSPAIREVVPPLTLRNPQWWNAADDSSEEFRLAQAFVTLLPGRAGAIRSFLSPVDPEKFWVWDEQKDPPRVVWRAGNTIKNLYLVLQRRLLEASRSSTGTNVEKFNVRSTGNSSDEEKPFVGNVTVPLSTIANFLFGRVSDQRIGELIWGLLPLTRAKPIPARGHELEANEFKKFVPWAYAVSKLVCSPDTQLESVFHVSNVPVPLELISRLGSGRIEEASERAVHRLRASGIISPFFETRRIPETKEIASMRLAAALLFPLSTSDLRYLAFNASVAADVQDDDFMNLVK